jgi:hypothetical protein
MPHPKAAWMAAAKTVVTTQQSPCNAGGVHGWDLGLELSKKRLIWRNKLANHRLTAVTTVFIRLRGRVSDRILIFGLVCFTIGVWLGRLTAHKPVLWGLLGS